MENVESFDQHAIIPASVAPRDSMLALEPHVSPATSMGSCADGVELPFPANLLLLPFSFLEVGLLWCVHADL